MVYKNYLNKIWYRKKLPYLYWPLLPFSYLYSMLIKIRQKLYHFGILKIYPRAKKIPLIVVGNLTVGGTGKTPCVIHIVELLKENGYKPGIVSRGYKGNHHRHKCIASAHSFSENVPHTNLPEVTWVDFNQKNSLFSDASYVGDEPLLMAKRLQCPVVVSRHRAKAVQELEKSNLVDVIISDDGLQHYAMKRDIEIILVDGLRRFGNGYCLPMGPLREPISRLKKTDFTLVNLAEGGIPGDAEYDMDYSISNQLISLEDYKNGKKIVAMDVNDRSERSNGCIEQEISFSSLRTIQKTVHAVAGLAHPDRFFTSLKNLSVPFLSHAFPDHYTYKEEDFMFTEDLPIIMTEKDAIKCLHFKNQILTQKMWVVMMQARVNPLLDARLLLKLKEKKHG